MYKGFLFIFITLVIMTSAQAADKVVYIENDFVKAGFLPDVGGRMVYFALKGGGNVLYSQPELWNEDESERITPAADAPWKAYNGHITWLGPQSEWWNHQDLIGSRKGEVWPPDPWLIYGNYTVARKTATSVEFIGPESPVSGVQLYKKFILKENSIQIEVAARNSIYTAVSWDLWSNARFDAFTTFKVPVKENGILKVSEKENQYIDIVKYKVEDGYFTYIPELPSGSKKQRISKAFLYPSKGSIFAFIGDTKLHISFDLVPKEEIHPEQALVEVYNCVAADGSTNLLELEHHSAYRTILPGESMNLREVWTLTKNE